MFKQIFTCLVLIFGTFSARAEFRSANPDFCVGVPCTGRMSEINRSFGESVHFAVQATDTAVYSGACYHLGGDYQPEQEHHSLAVFDRAVDHSLLYRGVFAYFANLDPYKDLAFPAARKYVEQSGSAPHTVTLETTKGHFTMEYAGGEIRYDFRTNESGSILYLLTQWVGSGRDQRTFCELTKH